MTEGNVSRETSPLRTAIESVLTTWAESDVWLGEDFSLVVDDLMAAVEQVPVVPPIEGNGSMDGVTPILYFEAGSMVMHDLRAALTWANVNHVRITIDDGHLKWKISEGTWTPGYPSEQENGGNG